MILVHQLCQIGFMTLEIIRIGLNEVFGGWYVGQGPVIAVMVPVVARVGQARRQGRGQEGGGS